MQKFDGTLKLQDCRLCGIGCDSVRASESEKEHFHTDFFQLVIVRSGAGKLYTANVPEEIKEGSMFLSFPFDVHRIESGKDSDVEFVYVNFSVNSGKFGDEFNRLSAENVSSVSRVFQDSQLEEIVKVILSEFECVDKEMSDELVSLLCSQLLVHILRAFKKSGRDSEGLCSGNYELCVRIMNYIDTNVFTIKSLVEISDKMQYNYCYLSSVFRNVTGKTLSDYYKAKRMAAARRLIEEEKLSVSEVAKRMNYSSIFAFSKAFKEYYGFSPSKCMTK